MEKQPDLCSLPVATCVNEVKEEPQPAAEALLQLRVDEINVRRSEVEQQLEQVLARSSAGTAKITAQNEMKVLRDQLVLLAGEDCRI